MKIGIIGFGQMGSFMAKLLKPFANLQVFDVHKDYDKAKILGVEFVSIEDVCQNDIVFLFPPILKVKDVCHEIKDYVKAGSIIIEGCSVMTYPIACMNDLLPKSVDIVGCHPLFGPQSGKDGVEGFQIVLSPVRTNRLNILIDLFEKMKLKVVTITPDEHDKYMAKTQALELFIGKLLINMKVDTEIITTPGFDKLVELKKMLEEDSEEIFNCIQIYNPHALKIRESVQQEVESIIRGLSQMNF